MLLFANLNNEEGGGGEASGRGYRMLRGLGVLMAAVLRG
jgi:hypothetical protein